MLYDSNIINPRLTLGLMGLDELHLRVLATSSEDLREKRNAQKGMDCGLWMMSCAQDGSSPQVDAKGPSLGSCSKYKRHSTQFKTYITFLLGIALE